MATSTIYANYAEYYYSSWRDAASHIYAGNGYRSRARFNFNLGDGRKIKITSGYINLYRDDGGTAKPTINIRFKDSSTILSSKAISEGTGYKKITFSSTLLDSINNMNGQGNFYLYIRSSATTSTRFTGYDNSAYSSNARPKISLTWDYAQSTGFFKNSSITHFDPLEFIIEPANSDYSHVVEWYINEESTPYYSQNLTSGEVNSNCTFFGDDATASKLLEEDYFSQIGDTIPILIKLITYDSNGEEVGTDTYNATLIYSNLITTALISNTNLIYGEPINIDLKVKIKGNRTLLNHYIGDKICYSEELNIDTNTSITTIYPIDEVYNYFSYYTTKKPFVLEIITYDSNDQVVGSIMINSVITCRDKIKKLIKLNQDVVVTTDSIISNNYFDNNRETLTISLSRIKTQILDYLHPIGSIYMSYEATNPSKLFGGTWEEYSPARTLYSTIDETAIGSTGGSFTHTLITNELPIHSHRLGYSSNTLATSSSALSYGQQNGINSSNTAGASIGSAGSGGAHNNTQPYSACYMWKRIA